MLNFQGLDVSEGSVPRSGRNLSEGWKNSGPAFRGLEKIGDFLPRVGRFPVSFSEHWKKWSLFFQTLEISRSVFPSIGRISSKDWKFCGQFFRALETSRGEARSRRGLRACGLAVSARRIFDETGSGGYFRDNTLPPAGEPGRRRRVAAISGEGLWRIRHSPKQERSSAAGTGIRERREHRENNANRRDRTMPRLGCFGG